VSGKRVRFIGDAMAAVVQGIEEVRTLIGQPPVVVGGLAVTCRLSNPYRATSDLDVVDRLLGEVSQLQVLRAARGAEPVEPASVLLPTVYGQVKVDVQDIVRLILDEQVRPTALAQLGSCDTSTAVDIALHVDLWLVDRRRQVQVIRDLISAVGAAVNGIITNSRRLLAGLGAGDAGGTARKVESHPRTVNFMWRLTCRPAA
jgi:hypothetical protein